MTWNSVFIKCFIINITWTVCIWGCFISDIVITCNFQLPSYWRVMRLASNFLTNLKTWEMPCIVGYQSPNVRLIIVIVMGDDQINTLVCFSSFQMEDASFLEPCSGSSWIANECFCFFQLVRIFFFLFGVIYLLVWKV